MNSIPTIDQIKALDGRIVGMLSEGETQVLNFYRDRGRNFDVSVHITNEADKEKLAGAQSKTEADAILKSSNSRVAVSVGPSAQSAWDTRLGQSAQ